VQKEDEAVKWLFACIILYVYAMVARTLLSQGIQQQQQRRIIAQIVERVDRVGVGYICRERGAAQCKLLWKEALQLWINKPD
jgi:hypothetical protein